MRFNKNVVIVSTSSLTYNPPSPFTDIICGQLLCGWVFDCQNNFETMRPGFFPCTPLVYSYDNQVKKCAHIGRTCPKNVRPSVKMCAPGAECTVNFEH